MLWCWVNFYDPYIVSYWVIIWKKVHFCLMKLYCLYQMTLNSSYLWNFSASPEFAFKWKDIVNVCSTTRLSFPLFFFFQPIVIVVLSRFSPRLKRTYVFREVEHWIIIALVCTKFLDKSTLIKFNPKCVKNYLNFVCSIQYWTSIIVEAMMIILIELTKHQGSMWKWNNLGKYWFRMYYL